MTESNRERLVTVPVVTGRRAPVGIDGAIAVGAGSIFHPARKVGEIIEVLCKCAAASPRIGRPPIRFFKEVKPNCPSAIRPRKA
jgi:hypothetical protein